jgi:hypothetical protein
MNQQDKSWTRGEIFSAISFLLSATGVTIALLSFLGRLRRGDDILRGSILVFWCR